MSIRFEDSVHGNLAHETTMWALWVSSLSSQVYTALPSLEKNTNSDTDEKQSWTHTYKYIHK